MTRMVQKISCIFLKDFCLVWSMLKSYGWSRVEAKKVQFFISVVCKRSRKFRLYFMPFFQALSPVLQKSHFVAATMLMLFSPSFWMDFNRLLSIRFSSFGKREGGVHSYPNSWWTFQNLAWPFFFQTSFLFKNDAVSNPAQITSLFFYFLSTCLLSNEVLVL